MYKTLMSPEELILHMENRGIQFHIITQEEAILFLTNNNYYKKFSCYKKNYTYAPDKNGDKKYQQLEFAYLKELSVLDMHLRYLIIQICLDIEHAVKIWIINNCLQLGDDGYHISGEFLNRYSDIHININHHSNSPYCEELINNYKHKFPIWTLLEVISFGDLCKLFKWINDNYSRKSPDNDLIFRVRELRNAAAHSHCLIRDLRAGDATPSPCISRFIANFNSITPSTRKKKLSNFFICDFVSTLYFYDRIVMSLDSKKQRYYQLSALFNDRMIRNKDYFINNSLISTSYKFCKKVVDSITVIE